MDTDVLDIFRDLDDEEVEEFPVHIEINNLVDADKAVGVIARADMAIERLKDEKRAIKTIVDEWFERNSEKYQTIIDVHTEAVKPFATDIIEKNQALDKNSPKSLPLFMGVAKAGYAKSQDKLVYSEENEENVKAWCGEVGIPLRTKIEIDKKALNEHWKRTGAIPNDATVIRGTDHFSVTVNKKKLQSFFDALQAKKEIA